MPLPIETPAPKASSIIKRFQQTIDNLDGQPGLPLPKPRMSQDPEEIAQNRRSWSIGSGGAPLPPNQPAWTAPPGSQLSKSSDGPRSQTDHQPCQTSTTTTASSSHIINTCASPQFLADHQANPTIPSHLDMPLTPPIHQSPDLSRLADLSQSDLAVQTPPTSSNITKTASARPKVKATISSDARQLVRSRKQTNITAPTTASLAKIRASDTARSQSQSNGPTTRNQSTSTSAAVLGANSLPKSGSTQKIFKPTNSATKPTRKESDPAHLRDVRAASVGTPKERPRMESIRASTPAPSTAFKKAVIAKTKVPPLPSFGLAPPTNPKTTPDSTIPPVKATRRVISASPQKSTNKSVPTSNLTSSATKAGDKRPLQRSRVASVATPISSGIKKSPSLKSSAAQPSARVSSAASPKLTITGTSGTTRSPDLNTPKAKTRISSVKGSSTVRKSPKLPSVPFPEGALDQAPSQSAKKPPSRATSDKNRSASRTPTQLTTDGLPVEKSTADKTVTQDPVTRLEEGTDGPDVAVINLAEMTGGPVAVGVGQEDGKEPVVRGEKGVEDPVPSLADRDDDPSVREHVEPPTAKLIDVQQNPEEGQGVDVILEELEGLKLAHQPLELLQKHHLPGATEEDEFFKRDFDASTATNTDGEE